MQNDNLPGRAGCATGPDQVSAGCANPTGDESQPDAESQVSSPGMGHAEPAPADPSEVQANPPQSLREFERALRALGFSRLQATRIARQGFAGATAEAAPDPEPDESKRLHAAIQRLQCALKGPS